MGEGIKAHTKVGQRRGLGGSLVLGAQPVVGGGGGLVGFWPGGGQGKQQES